MNYLKKSLIIPVIVLLSFNTIAQIENEIISMVDSNEIIINNGRKLILKSLNEANYKKARDVYYYLLTEIKDENCAAFKFHEQIIITTLISDWHKWLELAENMHEYEKPICYSIFYQIDRRLYDLLMEKIDSLINEEKDLHGEDKDLLEIYLYLVMNEDIDEEYSEKLKTFKKNYPQSRYINFIRNFLPSSKAKASFGFSMGTSQTIQTNNFGKMFSPGTMMQLTLDFNINKVYTSLYFNGGNLRLKTPFDVSFNNIDTTFNTNEVFSYIEGGLACGYFLFRTSQFHLAPYASVSGNSLKSDIFDADQKKEDLELKIINSFVCGIGLHTEIKLFEFTTRNRYYYNYPTKNHISLKVDIGYNYITKHEYDIFKGDMFYVRPTLVWGMGDF